MSAASDPSSRPDGNLKPLQPKNGLLPKLLSGNGRLDIARIWPVLFIAVTLILFCRQPVAIFRPSLFAEDGKIFFKQQYEMGFAPALVTHYAGYLHAAPRIIAAFCSLLPLQCIPIAYTLISLLVSAAIITFLFAPGFRPVINNDQLRAGIVLVFALLPNAEPLMKLAYLNWYMVWFVALTCLYALPRRSVWRWCFFALVAVAAWSNPVPLVCLPVILLRIWWAKERGEKIWWVALAMTVVAYPLTGNTPPSLAQAVLHDPGWKWALLHGTGYRVFCFFFFGPLITYPLPGEGWPLITAISLLLAAICVQAAFIAASRTSQAGYVRRVPLILLYLVLALPVPFILRLEWQHYFLDWNVDTWRGNGRYFFASTLMLCLLAGVVYERVVRDWMLKDKRRSKITLLLLLCWLSLQVSGFPIEGWQVTTTWSYYVGEIHAAEARVKQQGGYEVVHLRNKAKGFDFDLLVLSKSAKHKKIAVPDH